jgi:hypothetical protein
MLLQVQIYVTECQPSDLLEACVNLKEDFQFLSLTSLG